MFGLKEVDMLIIASNNLVRIKKEENMQKMLSFYNAFFFLLNLSSLFYRIHAPLV